MAAKLKSFLFAVSLKNTNKKPNSAYSVKISPIQNPTKWISPKTSNQNILLLKNDANGLLLFLNFWYCIIQPIPNNNENTYARLNIDFYLKINNFPSKIDLPSL